MCFYTWVLVPDPPYPLLGAICHTPAAFFLLFALAQLRLLDLHRNSAKSRQTGKENKLIQCSEGSVFSDHAEALQGSLPSFLISPRVSPATGQQLLGFSKTPSISYPFRVQLLSFQDCPVQTVTPFLITAPWRPVLGQHQKGNCFFQALQDLLVKGVLIEPSGLPIATHNSQVLMQLRHLSP